MGEGAAIVNSPRKLALQRLTAPGQQFLDTEIKQCQNINLRLVTEILLYAKLNKRNGHKIFNCK